MCLSPKMPSPPPTPEPIASTPTPPSVTQGITGKKQSAPQTAGEGVADASNLASNQSRKRIGRGSLRIPLANEGSGLNYPTS